MWGYRIVVRFRFYPQGRGICSFWMYFLSSGQRQVHQPISMISSTNADGGRKMTYKNGIANEMKDAEWLSEPTENSEWHASVSETWNEQRANSPYYLVCYYVYCYLYFILPLNDECLVYFRSRKWVSYSGERRKRMPLKQVSSISTITGFPTHFPYGRLRRFVHSKAQ